MAGRHLPAYLLALSAPACDGGGDDPPPAPPVALLADPYAWKVISGSDPFGEPGAACSPGTYKVHLPLEDFEVRTDQCHFLTVEQAIPQALPAGHEISIHVFHGRLWSSDPPPVEGRTGLAVEDEIVWEERVAIPALGRLLEGRWVADRELPAGTRLRWHVENHGDNTWSLLRVGTASTGDE